MFFNTFIPESFEWLMVNFSGLIMKYGFPLLSMVLSLSTQSLETMISPSLILLCFVLISVEMVVDESMTSPYSRLPSYIILY